MSHEYRVEQHHVAAADPDAIWQAIATGPGLDAWYMGRNEVVPPAPDGTGGEVRTVFGEYRSTADITAWDPPRHFSYRERPDVDGRFIAFEYLIEGRDESTSVVRLVVDGFLPQDDWEDEFEAMTLGGELFLATTLEYAAHFPGRTAAPILTVSPPVQDWDAVWRRVRAELGLTADAVSTGDKATVALPGRPLVDGVVYGVNPHVIGIRTSTALLRILRGFNGSLMTMHSVFEPVDDETSAAWTAWVAAVVQPRGESAA